MFLSSIYERYITFSGFELEIVEVDRKEQGHDKITRTITLDRHMQNADSLTV